MPRILAGFLILFTLLVIAPVAGADPVETTQGDLSPIGDVGSAATNLDSLLESNLTDAQARAAFEQALAVILEEYTGSQINEADLYMGALAGMMDVLNKRAKEQSNGPVLSTNAAMTPAETAYIAEMAHGRKTGIGIEFQLSSAEGLLYVSRVYENSPAERNGLKAGDRVLAIDGAGLLGRELDDVLALLRGQPGTPITLMVIRGNVPPVRMDIVLTREIYAVPTAEGILLDEQVAWLRIGQFHGQTTQEVRVILADMGTDETEALILDLRGNQGGLVSAIQDVASLFLEDGSIIGRLQDAQGRERDLTAVGPRAYSGEMVCLVNRWTSSGAELLATALQENDRAMLVGDTTAGKGHTESLYRLQDDLALRLTSTTLLSPLGNSWDGKGVTPDYQVAGGPVSLQYTAGSQWPILDVQVSFAIELLRNADLP